ncbi:MAG TPA: hypothetical protein VEZ46_16725 [Mycobacteriales bacterium]|jgi:hypothetical protein|nr:hypothetical protein [Mycobacteriales bacterium]
MGSRPDVKCREHGWQPSVLITRAGRASHIRDAADRFVCGKCSQLGLTPNETNSIPIGTEASPVDRASD